MRYIVGYTEDARGRDAIALASALAQTTGVQLDLVHVLSNPAPQDAAFPPERAVQEFLTGTADGWLDEGLAMVPQGLPAHKHISYADSFAEGLIEAATELNASLIVVGAARNGLLKRFTIGSVANALLHASPIPVALAPSGYRSEGAVTRMTCAVGTREGADTLLDVAVDAASRRHIPLRLISLVALGSEETESNSQSVERARSHADSVRTRAAEKADEKTTVTALIAQGRTIEAAIESLEWDDNDIVLIGSSRLAQNSQIFLGATANKMLRALPVPMVVVPRDYGSPC
ncbi:universal stress protein [Paenarthrobacter sp. PH39-S1]|uniref:universal stress protein n=1 Tax=Paenarthrobacter sp. PH39-S1 TaxID=3046204 RepID=UPI0024B920B6|nr:universal stress protein [Paenarthrobacter sp. PH39-S1]MDJ0357111.1 universal stress protein [Paenarthrobacter sp. PH39-S1]